MKRTFILFLIMMVPLFIFAQKPSYQDIVELKNGSIIKGIIIEQIPNEQIKIELLGGSVLIYKMDEISKIKKEIIKNKGLNTRDKGYIGINLGLSMHTGESLGFPNGATLSLIDFGYLFNSHFGIAGKWMGNGYSDGEKTLSLGGLMFGILGVAPLSEKVDFLARGLFGFGNAQIIEDDEIIGYDNNKIKYAYNLGIGFKFNVGRKIALLTNLDYIVIKDFHSLNMTGGIAYRF